MTAKQVKNDLQEIKYYYSRKASIDKSSGEIGDCRIYTIVERYNSVIRKAPCWMLDMYSSLYIDNITVTSFADQMSYTPNYVFKLHQRLIKFLGENVKEA